MRETIAIIGSGVAGSVAAYYLSRKHAVTVFEKENYFGGHVHTHTVQDKAGNDVCVDTGFVFFNKPNYPRFLQLLDELKIPYQPSKVSFGIGQKEPVSGKSWWKAVEKKLADKTDFQKHLKKFLIAAKKDVSTIDGNKSLQNYIVHDLELPYWFFEDALLSLASGAWSNDFTVMKNYQAKPVLLFLQQHGFLEIEMAFDWLCIQGGYDQYITAIRENASANFILSTPVTAVNDFGDSVEVETQNGRQHFDRVIFACHADVVLRIFSNPTSLQQEVLEKFHFHNNHGVLHTDQSIYQLSENIPGLIFHLPEGRPACLTSHLNPLQAIDSDTQFFFTLNPTVEIKASEILKKITYRHISVTQEIIEAQEQFQHVNTQNRVHFVGAYWGKAYHEDGVISARKLVFDTLN